MTKAGIYGIRNAATGKIYVGSAVLMSRRLKTHEALLRAGRHHSGKLQDSWNLHGADAFEFFVIEAVDDIRELLAREQYWIDHFDSFRRGYNARPIANSQLGTKMSKEHKAKISAALKGRPKSVEHAAKIRAGLTGLKRSDESRARISAAHRLRRPSEESKAKTSAALKGRPGKPQSEETKEKLRQASLKWWASQRAANDIPV